MKKRLNSLKVALICGGPSLERGISLNSARSVLDHLESDTIEIIPFYLDPKNNSYKISKAQLYSNTPSDFDFKLKSTARPLLERDLVKELKKCDIVFPVIHGRVGEDGKIQEFFEKNDIPFIASPTKACKLAFNKFETNSFLDKKGFFTLPSISLKKNTSDIEKKVKEFFEKNKIKKAIVKPATGGSSIGVFSVLTAKEAILKIAYLFDKKIDTEVVIEPFAQGTEFTIIILENSNKPVALIPTEIEVSYEGESIFDYRKKYLPTHTVMYHQPPRFNDEQIAKIRSQAEEIFTLLGMRDFARFDGWLLDNGEIWFSDINPISGMEQNSFLFQQGARIGFSHRDLLLYVLKNACKRYGIRMPKNKKKLKKRKDVHVLFGGPSSERQVSLMSGTNVWLKLRKSGIYNPKPFLLDFDLNVWELPYAFILNHTVEEILFNVKNAKEISSKLKSLTSKIIPKLEVKKEDLSESFFMPKKYSLQNFIKKSSFVFLGLHGSPGEDGTIQAMLEKAKVRYNGPDSKTSMLCMDKFLTAETLNKLQISGVYTANQKVLNISDLKNFDVIWSSLLKDLKAKSVIVKPRADGCSSGIFRLFNAKDLEIYIGYAKAGTPHIPAGTFKNQKDAIDMPTGKIKELLFENFIETDSIAVDGLKLKYIEKTGWIEVTVGVFSKGNKIHVMNPSITVAEGEVLSVEEKFQGGTGVNITPPPENIISSKVLKLIKERIGKVAISLGITGYSRIDSFVNVKTGEVSIIEANTLPGLTPSTVIYHQALTEKPAMFPTQFLETIIKNKGY